MTLVEHIISRITTGDQISIVVNRDGFLSQEDTRQELLAHDVELIPGHGLELRVKYELANWHASHVCLVAQQESDLMPDIRENHPVLYFSLYYDVLNLFDEDVLREGVSFRQANYLYENRPARTLNAYQTKQILANAESVVGRDLSRQRLILEHLDLDWQSVDTIKAISQSLCEAFQGEDANQINNEIAVINYNFQKYLDEKYGSLKSSSHVKQPKLVTKILPHLAYKHARNDMVALVVVDGMTYWQYMLLHNELEKFGMQPVHGFTFSWLPSITQLSRQAIFRGTNPLEDYRQSPENESKLWMDFWQSANRGDKKLFKHEINYYWGGLPEFDHQPLRLAYVDVDLDKHMHSSTYYSDLYVLTQNWCKRMARIIDSLHKLKYHIYITSDHGSICSQPWRALFPNEKNLLLNTSRGARHLIYEKQDYLNMFLQANQDILPYLRTGDRFAIWKDNHCFRNDKVITHGGSHFMEVIVPFVEIEP